MISEEGGGKRSGIVKYRWLYQQTAVRAISCECTESDLRPEGSKDHDLCQLERISANLLISVPGFAIQNTDGDTRDDQAENIHA